VARLISIEQTNWREWSTSPNTTLKAIDLVGNGPEVIDAIGSEGAAKAAVQILVGKDATTGRTTGAPMRARY
jgi:hypothetical protein